ncbi:MAG: penicillin-binding protein [Thermodesulfobacteriota bacterium]
MSIKPASWFRFRIFLVLFVLIISFMAVFAMAFHLQVVKAPELKKQAIRQHQWNDLFKPRRGVIYDRNMKEMAMDIEVESLYVRPPLVIDKTLMAKTLSPILGMSRGYIKRKLQSDAPFVWIKRQLAPLEAEKIKKLEIKGVGFLKEPTRSYPDPSLAAHTIGFSGVDSQGLEGIELEYNNYLRGEPGYLTRDRDARGIEIVLKDLKVKDAAKVKDVVLTIDSTLQYIAEKELRKTVQRFNARAGMVIIMDPNTGEVLAMVNAPSFDPNSFQDFSPAMWRNRAVTDVFEPGSTFKVFVAAAALEEGIVKSGDIFYGERGRYKVYNRIIHDYKRFGRLSVADIIKYSSNIGAVKIGEKLGEENLSSYIKRFGFGFKTGIDLPGESKGLVRDVDDWSKVSLATISFGQGISVTGIQLVTALSSIANGGDMMMPYVVKKIMKEDGTVLKEFIPTIRKRVLSPSTARTMKTILRGVTEADGTGTKASLAGYSTAGKTGTAQKVDFVNGGYKDGSYVSSFMGFLPVDNPKLSILVAIDEPQETFYGGQVAAPLFRDIVRQALPYLGILPDSKDVDIYEANEIRHDMPIVERVNTGVREDKYLTVPDFRGKSLRQVLREAKSLSVRLETKGNGRAVSQWPDAGTKVSLDVGMKVYFMQDS